MWVVEGRSSIFRKEFFVRVVPPRGDIIPSAAVAVFSGNGVSGIVMSLRIPVDTKERA